MKEQIIELLANGVGTSATAEAVGCDPSYVSQLADLHAAEIAEKKAARFSAFIARDKLLEDAEDLALKKTVQLIPFITRPSEAARVFDVLNTAKRKTGAETGANTNGGTIVNINISQAAAVQYVKSADNQIIEMDGRSMATLPAKHLETRLLERKAAKLLEQKIPATLVDKL